MSSSRMLIGYIAQTSPYSLICDGDACMVIGSRRKFKEHIANNTETQGTSYSLKKAWFQDILTGIRMGAAYAFDEEAYRLFYPLAQRAGLAVKKEDFSQPPPDLPNSPIHLVRVQWIPDSKG